MLALDDLLRELHYDASPHYREREAQFEPETVHLFRAAREAGVRGVYVFETSPHEKHHILPARPAVFVADMQHEDEQEAENEASQLHRRLWNLSSVPFLIVRLPHQVRVYTGFNYSTTSEQEEGLLGKEDRLAKLGELLSELRAEAIDSGRIWQSQYGRALNTNQRVDKRLLRSLKQLGDALKQDGLRREVAHALIGKYVYISYLRSRGILSDAWLARHAQITPSSVLTLEANVASLRKLVQALEKRFNGQIFPIDFDGEPTLKDKHVSWVASIFNGGEIIRDAPEMVHQLHLPFQAYDFRYIPVETFSAIYEQFIDQRKEKGAIYTPEFLADYLLSEVEWAKPLSRGMKILDPACGSGVFLVLAYRRLIEKEMARLERPLQPEELRTLLLESIYGVERERDACYVTEFSLMAWQDCCCPRRASLTSTRKNTANASLASMRCCVSPISPTSEMCSSAKAKVMCCPPQPSFIVPMWHQTFRHTSCIMPRLR